MDIQRRRALVLVAFLLTVAGLVFATAFTKVTYVAPPAIAEVSTPTPVPPPKPDCYSPHASHNYADAPKGSGPQDKERENSFGKSASFSQGSTGFLRSLVVAGELKLRLCGNEDIGGDCRLLTALQSKVDKTDKNANICAHDTWATEVANFEARINWTSAKIVYVDYEPTATVHTMYMVRGPPGQVPTVYETAQTGVGSNFLSIDVQRLDGSTVTLMLRLRCGFQPTW